MIELYLTRNNNETSEAYGKYYPRVSYKQTLNIHDMAKHMAEHNTPFSEGTIEGILRDFVKCTREQTLMGNTVKVDDLAIFKVSAIGNGCAKLYDPDTDKTISASIGTIKKTDKTGASVASLKLLAQATGEYTRDELNKVAKLSWSDKAAAEIAAAKEAALGGGGGSDNGGSQNSGSGSQSSGSEQGGNSGSGSQQEQQNTLAKPTIYASIGTISKTDKTGAAVQSLKLLAQATGEYTREELNKVAKLGWTDKAAAEIATAKAEAIGGGSNSGGNSQGGNDSGDGPTNEP